MDRIESESVSLQAPIFHDFEDQDSDPPLEDEAPLGDPFSVEDMGDEFVFIQPSVPTLERARARQTSPAVAAPSAEPDLHPPPPSPPTTRVRDIYEGAGIPIEPINHQHSKLASDSSPNLPYHPFASAVDYNVAKWAKELGPGDTALSKLLAIPGVSSNSTLCNVNSCYFKGCGGAGTVMAKCAAAEPNYRPPTS